MKIKNKYSGLRDFFIRWSSQAVSELGTAMTNFALIIWVYSQEGTASSITFLTLCSFLPAILFRFIAGAIADRWNKKRIILADLMSSCGTLTVLILYSLSVLQVWHLYVINFLLSFMNAFQSPASYVATSLLVPKEHYLKVSGLQSFSGSVITILAPALGSSLLAFDGMMSAFILGRTDGSQKALGMAEAAVALGVLAGSVIVTFVKPPKNKTVNHAIRAEMMHSRPFLISLQTGGKKKWNMNRPLEHRRRQFTNTTLFSRISCTA